MGGLVQQPAPARADRKHPTRRGRSPLPRARRDPIFGRVTQANLPPANSVRFREPKADGRAFSFEYRRPLGLRTFFWGGNVVAGKLTVGEVSPMAVTFLRWLISFAALVFVTGRLVRSEWRLLAPAWPYILVLASLGFTAFNALFYAAAHHTTAVNIAIIQGSTPIFVLLGTVAFGARLRMMQIVGVLGSIAGVILTASHGDFGVLSALAFNRGDAWLLIASILYAVYTLALRWRPPTTGLAFFMGLAAAACLTSLPLVVGEGLMGQLKWPSAWGWMILLYIALLPSLLC